MTAANDPLSLAQAAAERALRRAETRQDRKAARDAARVLGRVSVAISAGNVSRARELLAEAAAIAARFPDTPALLRNIEAAVALLQPQLGSTLPTGWRPSGVLAGPGDLGAWARFLGGSISPCCRVDFSGRRLLYIVGAEGARPDDGGPAWRRLGALEVDAAGRLAANHGAVVEHFPNRGQTGDYEEGVFSAVPIVDGRQLRLYVGEILLRSPGNVDVRTALYTSRDGLSFERQHTVSEQAGAEIGPVAVFSSHGTDRVIEFHKQTRGFGDWQLGIDGLPIEPDVRAVGAIGPIEVDGGRLAICAIGRAGSDLPVPTLTWYSFDPTAPRIWRPEDAPPIPIAHEGAIEPNAARVYVQDSWRDASARIVTLERTDSGDPIETALPHMLRSDPRAWPAQGEIRAVEWGGDLVIRWRGVNEWRRYQDDSGRWLYGHLCAVVQHEGRWIITGFEHLANAPGAPADVVDTRFERLGGAHELGAQMQLPGKRFERGEELYLFAAAPCRIGGGARYPQDAGLVPVRTRIARVRFGVDGVEDAEPSEWWA